nr:MULTISPECIES: hypothetical protein [Micrococcaceae]
MPAGTGKTVQQLADRGVLPVDDVEEQLAAASSPPHFSEELRREGLVQRYAVQADAQQLAQDAQPRTPAASARRAPA